MIQGLFETHIHVADLQRSAEFYEKVLGLEFAYEDRRRVRLYWIGGRGQAMLGIWEKEASQIVRQHFAFHTSIDNMKVIVPYLKDRGLQVRNFHDDGDENPFVFAWMPAVSIYFSDPDGHSLEFISMLPDEPKPEMGIVSWEEWETLHGRA
ncbi:glyoxalase [Gordoniibacillus kamchatkensis]|uniref:Glyoxalase n=1 Tax=Gordoniibacillus kamchatkensis TaxID=1590651 RepID=A0ABR5ALA2_9BACL|nr:VOC family protein [Paenibacillus sp. VKM B-2647]KIL41648.1 glyoxalase [Paenibacillus sp. VKM B-2647]